MKYSLDLLQRYGMLDCKPADTPAAPNKHLSIDDGERLRDPTYYRSLVGALQYLTLTRPEIAHSVHEVCKFMGTPRSTHLQAAKRILWYVKGSIGASLLFRPSPSNCLTVYVDSDWAGDPDDRRSTTGLCIFLGPNAVTWMSKKQSTVSRSSVEAEYQAIAYTTAELRWFCYLLRELGIRLPEAPRILTDSKFALFMVNNPVVQAKTRHIDIDYHYVREFVASKRISISHIPSQLQVMVCQTRTQGQRLLPLSAPLPRIRVGSRRIWLGFK